MGAADHIYVGATDAPTHGGWRPTENAIPPCVGGALL